MTIKAPLFSIIMPTRNRAHILSNALRSALNQTFDDYEIIIMANNCNDNTKAVVESLATYRVYYYETNETLSMPDNWDYAWTKATGKYITYLSDDDALVPTALQQIAEKALDGDPPVVSWEDAIYYYSDGKNPTQQDNLLLLFHFGDTFVEDVDASILFNQLATLEFSWTASIPKMNNCAVNRLFWNKWRGHLGRLFFPLAPDYSFAWISTQICDSIRIIHRPLAVRGISDNSIGSDGNLGRAGQTFLKEFKQKDLFSKSPFDLPISMNIIIATFEQINTAFQNCGKTYKTVPEKAIILAFTKQLIEFKHLLPDHKDFFQILTNKAKNISSEFEAKIISIINQTKPTNKRPTPREAHMLIRKYALTIPYTLKRVLLAHKNDLQSTLCVLGLRDDILANRNWAHVYVFGEAINTKNIYDMSNHVDYYYSILLRGKNMKIYKKQTFIRKIAITSIKYAQSKLHKI